MGYPSADRTRRGGDWGRTWSAPALHDESDILRLHRTQSGDGRGRRGAEFQSKADYERAKKTDWRNIGVGTGQKGWKVILSGTSVGR